MREPMILGVVARLGAFVAALGIVMLGVSAVVPPADDPLAPASASAEAAAESTAAPQDWRSALVVAGAICLAAGVGLVVLAVLPSKR